MLGSKDLSLIIILSALGGITSVLVGYAGRFLSQIPIISSIGGQFLSGVHVLWLILAATLVKRRGSASITGALKGLVETTFFSHISIFAFWVSFIEGFFIDIILTILRKNNAFSRYLAAGFSSSSNIIVLYFFFFPQIPTDVYLLMYFASFLSGLMFGGYLTNHILKILNLHASGGQVSCDAQLLCEHSWRLHTRSPLRRRALIRKH
jgi:ABC-type thiamin/hydroxymethylpyrimidine transport system permease subunit